MMTTEMQSQNSAKLAISKTGLKKSNQEARISPNLARQRRTPYKSTTTPPTRPPPRSITEQEIRAGWRIGSLKAT